MLLSFDRLLWLFSQWKCCGLLNGCTDWENGVTYNCGCVPDATNSTTCVPLSNTTAGCTSADSSDQYIYSEVCVIAVRVLLTRLSIYLRGIDKSAVTCIYRPLSCQCYMSNVNYLPVKIPKLTPFLHVLHIIGQNKLRGKAIFNFSNFSQRNRQHSAIS